MTGKLYRSPVIFALLATIVILIGTTVTMFVPMFMDEMHPVLDGVKPYTPLQLAGRDIYQREGCVNCHTQTVRPLKTEVMRYGEYSKAGEFAYDRPFLWGSKRTGPDLARVGGKYPDAWHYRHFKNPRFMYPESDMPVYGWLKDRPLSPEEIARHMDVLGFPYRPEEIKALKGKSELDALVSYVQTLGAVIRAQARKEGEAEAATIPEVNPYAGNDKAIEAGEDEFEAKCVFCHGEKGQGEIGPSLVDLVWLSTEGDIADGTIFSIIQNGTQENQEIAGRKAKGGMPSFSSTLSNKEIWNLVAFIRSIEKNQKEK
ncbi:MAG: c-type cytochrome [Deltaproteobacteria bacterium]|nr:c-type cytochrome [Deltaproteobacteria bacterium]